VGRDEWPEPGHPGRDERRVRRRAEGDDDAQVLAPVALAEHEGVLRADRHDQRGAGAGAEALDSGDHEEERQSPLGPFRPTGRRSRVARAF
jgi:hypothetical protein